MHRYEEPMEMPRGTHYGSNYWIMYSEKRHRTVKAYSGLEHENLLTLEMNPDVEYYCEQPLCAELYIDGKKSNAIFDVWVLYGDGREEYQTVRYTSDLEKSSNQLNTQIAWCQQNSFTHVIRTEKDIEKGKFFFLISKQIP